MFIDCQCHCHTAEQERCAIAKMTARCALSNEPLRRYGHSQLSKMAACRQLRFDVTRNSAIRSIDPENPTIEPNMKCIGSPVAEIRVSWGHMEPPFWGTGRSYGVSDGIIRKSDGDFL